MIDTAERDTQRCYNDPKLAVTSVQMDPYTYMKSNFLINIHHRQFSDLMLELYSLACNADKNCKTHVSGWPAY